MNRQEFVDALHKRLLEAGFSDEYASKQCTALENRLLELPDSTADEYTTEKNLDIVVKKLISQDGDQRKAPESSAQPSKTPAEPKPVEKRSAPKAPPSAQPTISDDDVEVIETRTSKPTAKTRSSSGCTPDQYVTCDHPKLLTALLGILCAPTILLLLGASFGIFAAIFILLAAAILVIALGIIALVGSGSIISLASLLYGATQVLSTPKYVGLHEIGFGLLVAGATMAISILLYNVAVRLIPYLFQKIAQLTKLFIKKVVSIAHTAVKGCEQL